MPSKMLANTQSKSGTLNLKTLSAAVVTALLFANAHAAGLGKLTVLSGLGQPLRAEIELTSVSKDEVGNLAAKLASPDAFRQAHIEYAPALSALRFAVEQRGERQVIRVSTTQPLNEPFVDMLLELSGPNGRLIREYTFLLDPPDLRNTHGTQVAAATPVPGVSSSANRVQSEPSAAARAASAAPARNGRQAVPAGEASAEEYKVKQGDTLAGIADQFKASGVSLDQMLVALYRANPDAFIGKNMNRLRAGRILSLPSEENARSISQGEARAEVRAQSADFNNYRSKLASQVAAAAPSQSSESKQSDGGKITAKVDEPATPASESKDKLKLSRADAAAGAAGAAVGVEDRIAAEKALAEANARVRELEKNVNDLQQLLEIKNKTLAELQQGGTTPAGTEAAAPAAAVVAAPATVEPAVTADAAAAEKPATEAAAPATPAAPAPAPAPAKPAVAAPAPAPEPSFIDGLLENPLTLPGLGALLVALGGLGIYSARRKKQQKPFEDSIITDSSLKANSLFGSTGGQSVDTNNSVFNSSFSPSVSQLDSNEVDPVAEADVYIAYGRDAQAEEILKEALRTQPDRHAVRVKLLEIYSNRKDLRAFEVLATELYGLTKGEGEEWRQAATLGVAIDPNNPLYASAKTGPNTGAGVLAAPTQPLDDEGLATLLATTQGENTGGNSLETDTAYFSNTALVGDKPLDAETGAAKPESATKAASNELDFDLDGMNLQDIEVPNTIPRPMSAEPSAEMASIDFDFLDTKASQESTAEPEAAAPTVPEIEPVAPAPTADLDIPDLSLESEPVAATPSAPAAEEEPAALDFDLPSLPEQAASEPAQTESAASAPSADSLDFDLSSISLELNPELTTPAAPTDLSIDSLITDAGDDASSAMSEMATKLDLALAYQEIGDKEGARELLDEVLKGGTPEQSEKAKSLLMELA